MKIKDYLETLPENINISGMKGLFGKELKILEVGTKAQDLKYNIEFQLMGKHRSF